MLSKGEGGAHGGQEQHAVYRYILGISREATALHIAKDQSEQSVWLPSPLSLLNGVGLATLTGWW
jgi:hypothetical protein